LKFKGPCLWKLAMTVRRRRPYQKLLTLICELPTMNEDSSCFPPVVFPSSRTDNENKIHHCWYSNLNFKFGCFSALRTVNEKSWRISRVNEGKILRLLEIFLIMIEEMEKCVLQNIPWANLPLTVKQVTIPTYFSK